MLWMDVIKSSPSLLCFGNMLYLCRTFQRNSLKKRWCFTFTLLKSQKYWNITVKVKKSLFREKVTKWLTRSTNKTSTESIKAGASAWKLNAKKKGTWSLKTYNLELIQVLLFSLLFSYLDTVKPNANLNANNQ